MSVQNTLSQTAPQKVYTSTFFECITCHEMKKKGQNVQSVWSQHVFPLIPPPKKRVCFVHSVKCWQLWTAPKYPFDQLYSQIIS